MPGAIITFQCKLCPSSQMKGYDTNWKSHLWSNGHQCKSREQFLQSAMLTKEHKEMTLVVFGLHGIPMNQVLGYFVDKAVISDFTFWKNRPDLCVVEFITRNHRDVFASVQHTISTRSIHIRLMDQIPDPEWLSICPASAAGDPESPKAPLSVAVILGSSDNTNSTLTLNSADVTSSPVPREERESSTTSNVENEISSSNKSKFMSLSLISSDKDDNVDNNAKSEVAVEEQRVGNDNFEESVPGIMPPSPSSSSSVANKAIIRDVSLQMSTSSTVMLEQSRSLSATVDKHKNDSLDQVSSQSLSSSVNVTRDSCDAQDSNRADSVSSVSSNSLDNENVTPATVSTDEADNAKQIVDVKVMKTGGDSDEIEFLCEQKKNENAPLIEIDDEDESSKDGSPRDLESMLEQLLKEKQISQKEIDFRLNVKQRLELHLRLKFCHSCRLVEFASSPYLFQPQKEAVLHLYLDRWGVFDENGNERNRYSHPANQRKRFFFDVPDMELPGLLRSVSSALKEPPADAGFIVTRIELGVGGMIDFKYTNVTDDVDSVQCRIHLKDFDIVQSSRLIKFYCKLDARIEPLMILILEWASTRKWFSNLVGYIEGETLVWLVVFFLVQQRFIPAPKFLYDHRLMIQDSDSFDFVYFGKIVSFTENPAVIKCIMAHDPRFYPSSFSVNSKGNPTARVILHLAGGMLLFYTKFDFNHSDIDLFSGEAVPKQDPCPMALFGHPFSWRNISQYVYYPRVQQFIENCVKSSKDVNDLLDQDKAEDNQATRGGNKTLDLSRVLYDRSAAAKNERRRDPRHFQMPSSSCNKRPRKC